MKKHHLTGHFQGLDQKDQDFGTKDKGKNLGPDLVKD